MKCRPYRCDVEVVKGAAFCLFSRGKRVVRLRISLQARFQLHTPLKTHRSGHLNASVYIEWQVRHQRLLALRRAARLSGRLLARQRVPSGDVLVRFSNRLRWFGHLV